MPVAEPPLLGTSSSEVPTVTAECTPPKTEYEEIALTFDNAEPKWKVGHSVDKAPVYSLTEFIREGDDIKNWRELFTLQNFSKSWGLASPEETLDALKAAREKHCPGATQWNLIEKSSDSILYEWQARSCLGWPEQHEIAKIMYGKYNRFSIHYVAKSYRLPSDTRSRWIKRLAESRIVLRCR
jgi:hypothetical protein